MNGQQDANIAEIVKRLEVDDDGAVILRGPTGFMQLYPDGGVCVRNIKGDIMIDATTPNSALVMGFKSEGDYDGTKEVREFRF